MLIDLLVALGVIALLSTITIPYLKKYQPNLKLNATARDITADLRYAQQLTVTEQTVHKVKFNLATNNYQILKISTATSTIKNVNLDPQVSFQQITGLINNEVTFNYYGGVSQAGQIILVNTNGTIATINVKPSGYIKLDQ